MNANPSAFRVTFDKYGFILTSLLIVAVFDVICVVMKMTPSDIVAIDGILTTVVGYGVLQKVATGS